MMWIRKWSVTRPVWQPIVLSFLSVALAACDRRADELPAGALDGKSVGPG
jgi:hypothetical protein